MRWVAGNLYFLTRRFSEKEITEQLRPFTEYNYRILAGDLFYGFPKPFLCFEVGIYHAIVGVEHQYHFRDAFHYGTASDWHQVKQMHPKDTGSNKDGCYI